MNGIDEVLQNGFDELADRAPHDSDLAGTVRRRSGYRRAVTWAPIAAAVAVTAVVASIMMSRPGAVIPAAPTPSACRPVPTAVLPTWARAGFSDPVPRAQYERSDSGHLLAILFGPLVAPPAPALGNKILWVADNARPGDTLYISGRLEDGTATMQAVVEGGPGPSGIDVPAPGCWLFDLTWGIHHDTINLAYQKS